jgi:hypothetical protein
MSDFDELWAIMPEGSRERLRAADAEGLVNEGAADPAMPARTEAVSKAGTMPPPPRSRDRRGGADDAEIATMRARIAELEAARGKCVNGPCPKCGDGPSGEWSEGSEVKCDGCGVILVVATVEECHGRSTFYAAAFDEDGKIVDSQGDPIPPELDADAEETP